MTTYSAKEIEQILGIPTRRIQFYIDSGLVNVDSPGRGRRGREFNRDNLLELALINALSNKCGLDLTTIKRVFDSARKLWPTIFKCETYDQEEPTGIFLEVFNGGESIRFRGERESQTINDNGTIRTFVRGPATKIEVDLSSYETVTIVNVLNIYRKITW